MQEETLAASSQATWAEPRWRRRWALVQLPLAVREEAFVAVLQAALLQVTLAVAQTPLAMQDVVLAALLQALKAALG